MDFYDILDQVIVRLQRHGRVSYRALKRHFALDDEYIDDLKAEILYVHPAVCDDAGTGLVWTDNPAASKPDTRREPDPDSRFYALLRAVMWMLQREQRVTYRELTHVFGLDEALVHELRDALLLKRVANDEAGKILVWTGETQGIVPPLAPPVPSIPEATLYGTLSTTVPAPVRSAPEAERRQLTVMFCDLPDSTRLSQQLDAEDLREVIRAYQATAAAVIQQYEGTIAQYLGDGLLVYFGWPIAHEDDAPRAVHAGLGIVAAITTQLNPRLERDKGVRVAVRIGIHTGPVVVGEMGGGARHEHLATGDTVNIASRLEGVAAPNTVVVSSVTARLVRETFALEDLGRHALKGVAEPMQVFRVLGPVEAHDDEASVPDSGVFLVGRDEEVGLLLRRWEQAKQGLGQVVLLSGEAGIGKSSLVATVRQQVIAEGYTRLTFRCSPYHIHSALYPVIAHVQRVLHLQPGETPETRLNKLEGVLTQYSRPLEEVVPLYAALLSVPVPEGCYAALHLSPQQQRHQTRDALVGWLLEEAERHPTLVMWEDLHWADPSTLELLGLVLEQTPTVPMLHVLTFRPEFVPPWPTRSHMTPMTLNRLERSQVEALIMHRARGKVLPSEVIAHIVAKTDGVPLYVEELTKMLLASDLLREQEGQYALTGSLSIVAIPDTLQDSLMARLDQLGTAKEVAQLGAVLGREFAYDMLQAIAPQDEETLQAGLTRLVEAELLYQRGRLPRARYIFKHALIQDAAYASLLRSVRQGYHQQVAQLLEARFPEVVETQPEVVAHHYTEAGQTMEAIRYWQQAGRHAIERSANVEAIAHLTRGLEVLKTLLDTPERASLELELQTTLGPALIATKGFAAPEVEQSYARARDLCRQVGETPQLFPVLWGLFAFYLVRGELRMARELVEQLLRLAESVQDRALLLVSHRALGTTLHFLGEFALAREHEERGIALYDPPQHRPLVLLYAEHPGVVCLCFAAHALWYLGYPDQALKRIQDALTLAQQLAHPYSLVHALDFAAWLHQYRRERRRTQEQAEADMTLATEHGIAFFFTHGTILRGWALVAQGQGEEGMAQIRQGLATYRATGAEVERPYWLALLAEAYGKSGQGEEGLRLLAEALAEVDKNGWRFCEAELYRLKGELLLVLPAENDAEAEACFQQSLAIARRQQAKSWELRAATSLARLWQQQGKRQEAYDLLAPVYGWFTEGFDTADLKDAKTLLETLSRSIPGESSTQ